MVPHDEVSANLKDRKRKLFYVIYVVNENYFPLMGLIVEGFSRIKVFS